MLWGKSSLHSTKEGKLKVTIQYCNMIPKKKQTHVETKAERIHTNYLIVVIPPQWDKAHCFLKMWFFLCSAFMNSAILYNRKEYKCICLSTGKKTFKLIWRDKREISWMSSVEWIHTVSPAIMIHFICTKATDTTYVVPIINIQFIFQHAGLK